jgi:hypothetical protein
MVGADVVIFQTISNRPSLRRSPRQRPPSPLWH